MYLALGKLGAETKKLVAHQIFLFSKSLMCSHPRLTEKNVNICSTSVCQSE